MNNDFTFWWLIKKFCSLSTVAFLIHKGIMHQPFDHIQTGVAQALVVFGFGLHLWHALILKRQCSTLITDIGLFVHIRHPMYLGEILMIVGLVGTVSTTLALAIGLFHVYALAKLITHEEFKLASAFPATYRRYQQNTGKLLPLISP